MPAFPSRSLSILLAALGLLAAPLAARPAEHGHGDAAAEAGKSVKSLKPELAEAAKASAKAASAPAAPAAASAASADTPRGAISADTLRERLAERLGAGHETPADGSLLLRVPARPVPPAKPQRAAAARPMIIERAEPAHPPHWSYDADSGPAAWGRMDPAWSTCATGTRQSPIDLRDGFKVELEPIAFDYRPTPFRVIDNGHTVQVNLGPGNFIEVMGRRFELLQFHFHRPSEERINGQGYELSAHLVHKDADGKLAVVGVLLSKGTSHPLVQQVWSNLPLEKNVEQAARTLLDPSQLLPQDRSYYVYMGSLTTPPCSEGVLWMVMKQPVPLAAEQIDIFARLYPMNARPLQSAAGRMLKESR